MPLYIAVQMLGSSVWTALRQLLSDDDSETRHAALIACQVRPHMCRPIPNLARLLLVLGVIASLLIAPPPFHAARTCSGPFLPRHR